MPADISGVGATPRLSSSLVIGPASPPTPGGPAAPSTAIQPVAPVAPRTPGGAALPLGRSGISALDLLDTSDVLVQRTAGSMVALDVGLESARSALLRQLPADSLSALDGIWERAQLTEEGWYLRSGALTVLGLPGEADRVTTEGLERKPASIALRFMQSLARLAAGNLTGARTSITTALEAAGDQGVRHPVLLVQQAILSARAGRVSEAERTLQAAARGFPGDPAVEYGRAVLRTVVADHTRSRSRASFGLSTPEPLDTMADQPELFAASGATAASVTPEETGNAVERAFVRFASQLATRSTSESARDARVLIRACSAGGSLSGACPPEQAHVVRTLLTTIVMTLTTDPRATAPRTASVAPLDALIGQWLPLMHNACEHDAARLLRKLGDSIPEAPRALLIAATQSPQASDRATADVGRGTGRVGRDDNLTGAVTSVDAVVQGDSEPGPLIPVRLGLALITPPEVDRIAARRGAWADDRAGLRGDDRAPADIYTRSPTPRGGPVLAVPTEWLPRSISTPYGSVSAVGRHEPRTAGERSSRAGGRVVVWLCIMGAAFSAAMGFTVAALALGVGAAWLGLRGTGGTDSLNGSRNDSNNGSRTV